MSTTAATSLFAASALNGSIYRLSEDTFSVKEVMMHPFNSEYLKIIQKIKAESVNKGQKPSEIVALTVSEGRCLMRGIEFLGDHLMKANGKIQEGEKALQKSLTELIALYTRYLGTQEAYITDLRREAGLPPAENPPNETEQPSFAPDQVEDLKLWLDADEANTILAWSHQQHPAVVSFVDAASNEIWAALKNKKGH